MTLPSCGCWARVPHCAGCAAVLSGRYPDKTRVWNFINDFRDNPAGKSWTALPEFFRNQGFFTTGAGKVEHDPSIRDRAWLVRRDETWPLLQVYHPGHPPNFDQLRSWSEPWLGQFSACACGECEAGCCAFLARPMMNGKALADR